MDFDPDSMTCVRTSREFTSLRVYTTVRKHGHEHCRQTRNDQQFIIVRADLQIGRHSPTIEIINNI